MVLDIRASILLDGLKERFSVSCCGKMSDVPLLRPTFYQDGDAVEPNRVYIVRPHMLPPKESLDESNLLLCAEGLPSLPYQHARFPVFIVADEKAITVFNTALAVFERYDVWENSLRKEVDKDADIAKLVQLTVPLLHNDITVLDKELRVIAAISYQRGQDVQFEMIEQQFDTLPVQYISQYQKSLNEFRKNRGAFFADGGCYCVNLYEGDTYYGNISLYPMIAPLRPSDPYVIDVLASFVHKALLIQSSQAVRDADEIGILLRKLLDGESVDEDEISRYSHRSKGPDSVVCLCFHFTDKQKLPVESICRSLSKKISDLIVFPYNSGIVGICRDYALEKSLRDVTKKLSLFVGVSNCFSDIRKLRFYYQQAQYALAYQESSHSPQRLSFFRDHTLRYLMINSAGVFPAEYLCPPELLRLRNYDEYSNVDYWGTLRCYLDEQMNLAQTARALGIHRNTLIQRIERISSILENDLKDPMYRLWARVAIYLCDLESGLADP